MANRLSAFLLALTLVFGLLVAGRPAAASQDPGQWTLRLTGVLARYDGGSHYSCGHTCLILVEIDDVAAGLGVAVEYRILRRLGLELDTTWLADPGYDYYFFDLGRGGTISGELRFQPLLLGLNVHLTPASRLDLYAGALYGHVFLSGGRFRAEDDDNAVGFQVGADWPLKTGRWVLHGDLRYLDVLVRELSYFDLNPLSLGLGVGCRF